MNGCNGCGSLRCEACAKQALVRRSRARRKAGGFGFLFGGSTLQQWAPSEIQLSGWYRGSWANPWTSAPSAGTSGSAANITGGSASTAYNGFTSGIGAMTGGATGGYFSSEPGATYYNVGTAAPNNASSGWVLLPNPASDGNGTDHYQNVMHSQSGVPTNGVSVAIHQNVGGVVTDNRAGLYVASAGLNLQSAFTFGQPILIQWRFQYSAGGSSCGARINGGSWVTGNNSATSGWTVGSTSLAIGSTASAILDIGIAPFIIDDGTFDMIRSHLRERYGIASI